MPPPVLSSEFEYHLPEHAIAQTPVEPRHAARLLDTRVMEDRVMEDRVFSDLPSLLNPGDLVVVNSTKVRPARLLGKKDTGGVVELLLLDPIDEHRWSCLVRPARRIRPGVCLVFGADRAIVVTPPEDGKIIVEFDGDGEEVARRQGVVPLPPYIHEELIDEARYQTVYADRLGSAAAPTAGLHFTDAVLEDLRRRDVSVASVDLAVGLDTFRPISASHLDGHVMHSESVEIPRETAEAVMAARGRGSKVVAIGTTVVRTLESGWRHGRLESGRWSTDLFIRPGYEFGAVDAVVTNFHVPGSTLVVMVATMLGDRWRDVYSTALERGYRFLSFGDAMYIELDR